MFASIFSIADVSANQINCAEELQQHHFYRFRNKNPTYSSLNYHFYQH